MFFMDENNINNVNPNEETNNVSEEQAPVTPEPQVQQNANQGAYNQQNQNVYNQNNAQPASDGKATASLVCGIVGFFCCGLVLGIIAIVMANQYFQETGDLNNGKAKAGKICGIINIVLWGIGMVIYLALIASGTVASDR